MIDVKTGKGQTIAALIVGLAAAHGVKDDPASAQVPGAVDFARALMVACARDQQKAIEQTFREGGSPTENAEAAHKMTPNGALQILLKSMSYEHLKEMSRAAYFASGMIDSMGKTVQFAAMTQYPEKYKADMPDEEEGSLEVHVIDLGALLAARDQRERPGKQGPMVS